LCGLHHSPLTSSRLGPNIFLSTLFSNTLSVCSSLNVRHQISQPHKTTGKIIFLYILTFIFLANKLEDKRFCTEWGQLCKLNYELPPVTSQWSFVSFRNASVLPVTVFTRGSLKLFHVLITISVNYRNCRLCSVFVFVRMAHTPKILHTRDLVSLTQFPHKACKEQTQEIKL